MTPPRVSKRILASHISLDGRKDTSAFWGPPAAKRFKMVKMCPRKACGLEPQHCLCCCDDCGALLRGLKRCKRKGCTFGANRSPEVTTPPQESPPRARLPSKPSPSLSPPRARRALCYSPPTWPGARSPGPDHWTLHCPCEWCPHHHFRPHRVLGITVWHAAYRAHRAAGILPGHPLWGLSPEARKTRLMEMRQQREQQQQQLLLLQQQQQQQQ